MLLVPLLVIIAIRAENVGSSGSVSEVHLESLLNQANSEIEDPADSVHFFLYTRDNPLTAQTLYTNDEASLGPLSASKVLKVIQHGFSETGGTEWVQNLKAQLLAAEDANVIIVDWGDLAKAPWYWTAASSTKDVGTLTGELLNWLFDIAMADRAKTHVIGFSLGAHCAGVTGNVVSPGGKLGWITGLDPARPLFEDVAESDRLTSDDAEFIDVIHTNSGTLLLDELSWKDPVGHIDFYPNGGSHQPGCTWTSLDDIFTKGFHLACSHSRAHEYYIESVSNPGAFWAVSCPYTESCENTCTGEAEECNEMGYYVRSDNPGVFYLDTNSDPPYSF